MAKVKLSPRAKAIRAAEWRRAAQIVRLDRHYDKRRRKIEMELLERINAAHELSAFP